jgi:hypothetical protein
MKRVSFIILAILLMGCQTSPVVVECPCAIPVDATVMIYPRIDRTRGMRELARKTRAKVDRELEGGK